MFLPLAQVVSVVKRGEDVEDSHGNATVTWAAPVECRVYGYGPRSADGSAEPFKPGRDLVIIGLTVYGPPLPWESVGGEQVTPTPLDRFEVGGELYEVDGGIGDWTNGPFGWAPGVSVALRRVEG